MLPYLSALSCVSNSLSQLGVAAEGPAISRVLEVAHHQVHWTSLLCFETPTLPGSTRSSCVQSNTMVISMELLILGPALALTTILSGNLIITTTTVVVRGPDEHKEQYFFTSKEVARISACN
jgi:hypothetical protein